MRTQATGGNFVKKSGDTMTGALEVDIAASTDALKVADASSNKKFSIQHGTNTVKQDFFSPEPTNKLSNSGFETDLSSWSGAQTYTLDDEFSDTRAAGSVNGTLATDGVNTRTVTDTNSKLSIGSGVANFATGGVGTGNPGLWYPALSRSAGKVLIGSLTYTSGNEVRFGLDTNQSGADTISADIEGGVIQLKGFGGASNYLNVGSLTIGTQYTLAYVLRTTGAFLYIKGGTQYTNWTLIWSGGTDSSATLYPELMGYTNSVFTADYVRIPTATWLPTPLAYDTFTRADGALGTSETTGPDSQTTPSLSWTGSTWTISTNKAINTPTLGSELLTNGNMETGNPPTSWTTGTATKASVADERTGGSGTQSLSISNPAAAQSTSKQSFSNNVGDWLMVSEWGRKVTNSNPWLRVYNNTETISFVSMKPTTTTTWTQGIAVYRATETNNKILLQTDSAGIGDEARHDDISVKPLTLSSLFSSVSTSDKDVVASADIVLTAGTQAGLVTNLDSTSSPANFLIAYHNGTNVKLEKNVGGTYTTLINTAATYSAGATLRVITYTSSGSLKVRVYYNNALIGSEQTVSDAGIISNTKHGLFSTYSANTLDNFTLFARGSDGEYNDIPADDLTATRDTGTKYAGTASAKLVSTNDMNFLQSVNVGDTSTYTLTAYAYTDGSAVTTNDLNLYYDTGTISTTFTDMGSGWYKLTGTLTGVASAKNYGVRVKANKTVYVDSFSLQAGTGVKISVTFENSGTGSSDYKFEGGVAAFNTTPPTSQPAKISDPSGGGTIDTQSRTAINSIIDVLEGAGLSSST